MHDDRLACTTVLMQAARGGDGAAVDRLFATFLPRVRRIVAARMGRRLTELADVDDVVQETLLDLFRSFAAPTPMPDSMGQFYLWLVRCVERNVADRARAAHAQKRGGGAERRFADVGDTSLLRALPIDGKSPASDAGGEELDHRLEQALLGLRDEHRQVVVLRVLCDLSFAEIASELGHAGPDLSRAWFARAMAALRARLDGTDLAPAEST